MKTSTTRSEIIKQGQVETIKLGAMIATRICEQLAYNLDKNIPLGIVEEDDAVSHAVRNGLVSALGRHLQWDVNEALSLCADILEDVNAHKESEIVRKMIES